MSYTGFDDYINKTSTLNKVKRVKFNKASHPVSAAVAGEFSCLFHLAGAPTNGILNGGTNRSFQSLCSQSVGAMLIPGPMTGGETMTALEAACVSAAATATPSTLHLVDLLGYYPASDLTLTGAQATINSIAFTAASFATDDLVTHTGYDLASFTRVRLTTAGTLPGGLALATDYWTVRQSATTSLLYPSFADAVAGTNVVVTTSAGTGVHTLTAGLPRSTTGAGVECFSTVTTLLGAGTPTVALTYTDHLGNLGNVTPTGLGLPIHKAVSPVGLIPYSGTGSGKFNPYFPLATGDDGIRSIQSINQNATQTSGAVAYCLAKEIASLPMSAVGVSGEREFLSMIPGLPIIEDGACLAWLLYNGAATPAASGFIGHVGIGWG